ncbi:MAG: PadR family transcriptional regulator [Chloroflexi bacterium]|nr:PadR family transcriptional regulator [Chloroflexota bacterium]
MGLLREQGMHGYQLLEFIETRMASCVDLKKPTAYFILDKMAAAGWITFEQGQEGNRPPRRVYSITPAGEQIFQRLLRENLGAYSAARFASDIGLAFAEAIPHSEALMLLTRRRMEVEKQLASAKSAPEHPGGAQLIIEHQAHYLLSELAWLNKVIMRFELQAEPANMKYPMADE